MPALVKAVHGLSDKLFAVAHGSFPLWIVTIVLGPHS
jgi:hypothetical protein